MNWKRFFAVFVMFMGLLALQSSGVVSSVVSEIDFSIIFCVLMSVGFFWCIDWNFFVRMCKLNPDAHKNEFRIGYLIPFGICFISIPAVIFPIEVLSNLGWLNLFLLSVGGVGCFAILRSIFSSYFSVSLKCKN